MSKKEKALFNYHRYGFKFYVYADRILVIAGTWPFYKRLVIPMSSVASVETRRLRRGNFIITTLSGKVHTLIIGGRHGTEKAQDAIIMAWVAARDITALTAGPVR